MSRIINALKQAVRFARGDKTAGKSRIVRVKPFPGTRERAVLHAIRVLHGNAYGVSIQEELERARMDLSFGAIYNCAEWLEENGFVTSRMGEATAERGGRRKKFFDLTAKGEEALRG